MEKCVKNEISDFCEIEKFYNSTRESILKKVTDDVLRYRTGEFSMNVNRWWFQFLRRKFLGEKQIVDMMIKRHDDPDLVQAYNKNSRTCAFIIEYRGKLFPFYRYEEQYADEERSTELSENESFYTIYDKVYHCLDDQNDMECLFNILDQIDILLDYKDLLRASQIRFGTLKP